MIELYTWMTDNGYKARHGMEESGIPYELKPVNIREKRQFDPAYLKISPGHKIPALIDHDGPGGRKISLCESGAILKYVGEKSANGLYPSDPAQRIAVDQWLFYASATWTTLAQQYGYFWKRCPEDVRHAKTYYDTALRDMLGTFDRRLSESPCLAGPDLTVADIAAYADVHLHGHQGVGLAEWPNVQRWHDSIAARPATQRAWEPFAEK